MPLTLVCFHHSRITFILKWDPSISTVLIDKGKECFTMTYWAFQGRHETSKYRNTIKYMCTHPHFPLSLYIKCVFLTLKFYCITLLAENGKILSQLSVIISSVHITGNFGRILLLQLSCLNAHI